MIKRQRYEIRPLPKLPPEAQFMINGYYALINEDSHLELWYSSSQTWVDTGKTLSEYNDYWEKTTNEITLREYLKKSFDNLSGKNYYFFYDPATNRYYHSYNRPVQKGFVLKDGVKLPRMKAGETCSICPNRYPQIIRAIDMMDGNFDLLTYEKEVRQKFEHSILITGAPLPQFNLIHNCYYGDSELNKKYEKYITDEFFKLTGVVIEYNET